MEKKNKSLSKNLPPVKLFLKDVKKIIEIFKEIDDSVQIETADYILENVEELSNIDVKRISNISFKIYNPYISLELSEHSIWLYASSDDFTSKSVFNELKDFLVSKRRKLHNFIESTFITGVLNGFFIVANSIYIKSLTLGLIATIGLITSIFYTKWVMNQNLKWYTIIYLTLDKNELNFFYRKKDEIILIIISSILGAILGGFVTYFITK